MVRFSSELEKVVRKTVGQIIADSSYQRTSQACKESELALLNRLLDNDIDNWGELSLAMRQMLLQEARIRGEIRQMSFFLGLKQIRWGDWEERNIAQILKEILRYASNEWNAALHQAHRFEQASYSHRAWLGREKAVILKDICIRLATLIEEVETLSKK